MPCPNFLRGDIFDHRFVVELYAREERFRKSDSWRPPAKWRSDWLDASPGVRAIFGQEGNLRDPNPGDASAIHEMVRDLHAETAIKKVIEVKNRRDQHCLNGTASRGLKIAQQAVPQRRDHAASHDTSGQVTPRRRLLPTLAFKSCAETSLAKPALVVARPSGTSTSQEPRPRRIAARTDFAHMATSPTFLHRDDICWFGQVEDKKAPSSARTLVAAGASTARASATGKGGDFFWFGKVGEKRASKGNVAEQ